MKAIGDTTGLLSIIIPVYNERAFLRRLVERVLAAPLPDGLARELIIVDDASSDGTAAVAEELAREHPDVIRVFHQEVNQGKGAAIRRGIQEMRGQYAIFQDADLEYDPREYSLLLQPILQGHADVVYGSRFGARAMKRVLNYHHALGNKFLTHLSNLCTGLDLTDMETCYKAFRADILRTIPLRSNRFGIEPEITAKIAKRNCAVYEVPISYYGRTYAEGKKIGWRDGLAAIFTILKYWLIDDCYHERYGHEVLSDLSRAHRFNRWLAAAIAPALGDRILEVGAGIGNISRLLPVKESLVVTDKDEIYLNILRQAFWHREGVEVAKFDLDSDEDAAALSHHRFDTVVCLNVLEHIQDDRSALCRLRRLLAPGRRLVLLVPQYDWLYGSYDQNLGHHRRYEAGRLEELLNACGFRVRSLRSFNALAIVGWYVNSRLLKRQTMGKVQIKCFDMLVPLMRIIEKYLPLPGISLLCLAEAKP
ncbi:MAG: bifunctional glycosyltransferase/class I SAM-dependent methyltransferase [Planctomycetota bacterium]|nr:bifunctional glycosyltransferase/class I SAM-dependent methyltransferase [Planctomycetota bacterium]